MPYIQTMHIFIHITTIFVVYFKWKDCCATPLSKHIEHVLTKRIYMVHNAWLGSSDAAASSAVLEWQSEMTESFYISEYDDVVYVAPSSCPSHPEIGLETGCGR